MFCGKYVTPVAEGYLEHLDQIRGQGGSEMAAAVDRATKELRRVNGNGVNGNGATGDGGWGEEEEEEEEEGMGMGMEMGGEAPIMTEHMDIGLPNVGDSGGR